jgi:Rne/Rng family ribonuclease
MSKELVISANRHETRVAIVEDDQVAEVYHQRENEYSLAGSIHKGRVTRVLPGMQSAFVDIGLDRDAFLYVSDFFEDNEEYDKIVTSVEEKVLKLDRVPQQAPPPAALVAAAAPVELAVPAEAEEPPAPVAVPADASAALGPPQEHRRDDRERRGRRGRRRRGQKNDRRALPESKYYSPGQQQEERPAEEPAAEPHVPETDDFFVLPGESLAKYTGGHAAEEVEDAAAETAEPFEAAETAFEPVQAIDAAAVEDGESATATPASIAGEAVSEIAAEPAAEPQPELSAAATEVAEEVPERTEPAEAGETEEAAEIAEDVEPLLVDAAEPVESTEAGEASEAGEEGQVAGESEDAEITVEEEGPEPARIPTSLTATLREQGPRYLHRVSRRTRRRGRDGREGREGQGREGRPPAEGHRAPQQGAPPEAVPAEQGFRAPEQRAVQAPRPEPRIEKGAPSISDLLREGQEIIVQIAKEPLGQKGARITSHIALPGRFLVYMPTVDHIGVSRKIPSDDERSRLKRILQSNRTGIPGGFIVRTAGEGRSEEELRADMMFLYNLWLDMRQKAERKPAPALIHHDLNVVERVLRDQLTSAFKSVWVDNEEAYESVLRFVQRFQPALVNRVKMYTRSNPIFEEFGITAELEKALRPKVWLKSGGYIVINQTEALVAIDINTGKFVGKSNRLEDTIVKTNTDAIKEIVRQIRLRDLGGIIVVDFIDMDERKNRQKVMQALEEAMRADRAPYKILQFNDFGLVAITRKRVKQSLERTLCTPCPYCEGAGYVKSPQTVVGEILQEAQKIARAVEGKDVMLRVAPDVAKLLKSNQNSYLQELEEVLGRTVIVKSDSQLHQEKFDLA